MLNSIVRYFDLQSGQRSTLAQGHGSDGTQHLPVFPQYIVVSAGVIVEPMLRSYIETGQWNVIWHALIGRVVFGLIVGIIILPSIYKSSFDPQKPILIQLAALLPLGIGWQSLFTTATQIVIPK